MITSRIFMLIASLTVMAACTKEHKDVTSPCVGIAGSPCERHPVNTWLPS